MLSFFKRSKDPLPCGVGSFENWSDLIIYKANVEADHDSQKFALATMILSLGPTDAFKEDEYFVKALIKGAANQIAQNRMEYYKNKFKEKMNAEVEAQKSSLKLVADEKPSADSQNIGVATEAKVLGNKEI